MGGLRDTEQANEWTAPSPPASNLCTRTPSAGLCIVAMEMRTGNPQEDGSVPMSTFLVTVHEGAELLPNVPLKTVKVLREMRAGKPTWFAVFMFVEEDADEIDDPSALPVVMSNRAPWSGHEMVRPRSLPPTRLAP